MVPALRTRIAVSKTRWRRSATTKWNRTNRENFMEKFMKTTSLICGLTTAMLFIAGCGGPKTPAEVDRNVAEASKEAAKNVADTRNEAAADVASARKDASKEIQDANQQT